jgi:hypothetical protein
MFTSPPILGDWHRKNTQPNQKNTNNHDFGIHLKAYKNDSECNGPDPEYCTVYCKRYWNCQLVLNEIMKR